MRIRKNIKNVHCCYTYKIENIVNICIQHPTTKFCFVMMTIAWKLDKLDKSDEYKNW